MVSLGSVTGIAMYPIPLNETQWSFRYVANWAKVNSSKTVIIKSLGLFGIQVWLTMQCKTIRTAELLAEGKET